MAKKVKILDGLKVANFAWAGVGAEPASYLASLGATVVKLESMTRPDPPRAMGPYKDNIPGVNRSGLFCFLDPENYSAGLNLSHPKGPEIAKRIIMWSDVVCQSFTGGTMAKWGLGYEQVRKFKPDIIYYSTCMQGQTGPQAAQPGFGVQMTALSGFTYLTGWPDRIPSNPYGAYTDFINIRIGIFCILAALDYKRRTGKGQHIDLSQYEGGILFIAPLILDYLVNGRNAERMDNHDPKGAPHGVYRCKGEDNWCAISVFSDEDWKGFCKAIGNPEWVKEERFATFTGRKENEDKLDTMVEAWTVEHTAAEVMARMQAAGVAAGVANRTKDTFEDPQLRHRGWYIHVNHCELGDIIIRNNDAQSLTPKVSRQTRRASPCLGEHTEYFYTKLLGMPDSEFAELMAEDVLE